ncbi:MAG: LptF/LptG family permease [Bacteroidota bacterium]
MLGKRLDWMVLRMFLGPFLMSFMIILFILVMQFMALYMNEIFGKGLDPVVMGKLFVYAAGRLLLSALPVALLAGSLMTFGSMGEHYELAALKSCGIGLFKTVRSVFAFSIVLMLGAIWVSFDAIPQANLKFFSLLYDVQRKKPDVAIKPGYFYSDIDGYVIRISDKNPATGALYDVLIYNHTDNRGAVDVIKADSAYIQMQSDRMMMALYSGVRHEEYRSRSGKPESYPYGRTYFDSLYYRFTLDGFDLDRTDESSFKHQIVMPMERLSTSIDSLDELVESYNVKSVKQLSRYHKIDSLFLSRGRDTLEWSEPYLLFELDPDSSFLYCFDYSDEMSLVSKALVNARAAKSYIEFMIKKKKDHYQTERSYVYEFYLRYAQPVNCILFILIGASLGSIIRKGGIGPPALVSIVFFMIYYVLTTYGKKFAREGVIEPWVGAWLSVLVLTPIAVLLTYRAAMDSRLLDRTAWGRSLRRLFITDDDEATKLMQAIRTIGRILRIFG